MSPIEIGARQDYAKCSAELDAIPTAAGNAKAVLRRRDSCFIDNSELKAQYLQATEAKLEAIEKLDKATLANVPKKHAQEIKALRFSDAFLKATIYLQVDMYNRPRPWLTMETWLGKLFENGKFSNITRITSGGAQGVLLKRPGMQSGGLLFVLDGGDLFPSHFVGNGKAELIESVGEQVTAAAAITQSIE